MTQKLWLTLFFGLLCSSAQAEEWAVTKVPGVKSPQKCHPGDPTKCAIFLRSGEKAPWMGVLNTPTQMAALAAKADKALIQRRIDVAVERATAEGKNDLELEKKYREIDNTAWKDKMARTEENYGERIQRLEDALPSWYEEPWFVSIASSVAVLSVVGASVAIACELRGCS
jgi:hypothetical protein